MAVYLIHFSTPLKHARHYLGYAENLERRLSEHRSNHGAKLLAAVNRAGISWHVVVVWQGGREKEKKFKRQKNNPHFCPICNPK